MTDVARKDGKEEGKKLVGTGKLGISTRGRTFKGTVTKRFEKRVVVEFEGPDDPRGRIGHRNSEQLVIVESRIILPVKTRVG